jgi:UDP:flavonoid glycosyltransferase YjiC (YdhE family)
LKYLLCTLEAYGYTYPAIGIARELRRRGHEVAFVTGPAMAQAVRQAGFERIPRGPQDGKSFQVKVWLEPLEMSRQVRHIEYALEHFPADVLLGHQLVLGPLIVGERRRLPVASLGFASYVYPLEEEATYPQDTLYFYRRVLESYNATREVFGLPRLQPRTWRETPLLGDLFLMRTVEELVGPLNALPEQVHAIGACLWEPEEREDPELTRWLEDSAASGLPILYVQPGQYFTKDPWPHMLEALADKPIRVAATVRRPNAETAQYPANFFVRQHIPQQRVLRHAQAVFSNSASTAVLGALSHGLPLLLLPDGGESHHTSDLCLRAGVARTLDPLSAEQMSVASLGQAVDALLHDAELRRNAQRLQQSLLRLPSEERAADLLELLAARRAPLLRRDPLAAPGQARAVSLAPNTA